MSDKVFWREIQRMTKARAIIYSEYPRLYEAMNFVHCSVMTKCVFCSRNITSLNVSTCDCGKPATMAVSPLKDTGKYNFEWNPYFTASLTDKQLRGVILHELLHIILGHTDIRLPYDPYDIKDIIDSLNKSQLRDIWNVSTDCSINSLISEYFLTKQGHIGAFPSDFGQPDNENAEFYYKELLKKLKKVGIQNILKNNNSLDDHSQFGDGEGEEEEGDGESISLKDQEVQETKRSIKEAIQEIAEDLGLKEASGNGEFGDQKDGGNQAGKGHPNSGPKVKLNVGGKIRVPKWKEMVTHVSVHGYSVREFPTRKRPNRRYGIIFPGKKRINIESRTLVAVDVSGSISMTLLNKFNQHLNMMRKHCDFDVIFFSDTLYMKGNRYQNYEDSVESVAPSEFIFKYKKGMECPKGGGTSFEPVIRLWNRVFKKYNGLFIFTDGEATYFTEPYSPNRIGWLLYGTDRAIHHGKIYVMEKKY